MTKNSSIALFIAVAVFRAAVLPKTGWKALLFGVNPIESGRDGTTSWKTDMPPILPYMGKTESASFCNRVVQR